jgi:hypothetical protein
LARQPSLDSSRLQAIKHEPDDKLARYVRASLFLGPHKTDGGTAWIDLTGADVMSITCIKRIDWALRRILAPEALGPFVLARRLETGRVQLCELRDLEGRNERPVQADDQVATGAA